jgi:hypothetical protein
MSTITPIQHIGAAIVAAMDKSSEFGRKIGTTELQTIVEKSKGEDGVLNLDEAQNLAYRLFGTRGATGTKDSRLTPEAQVAMDTFTAQNAPTIDGIRDAWSKYAKKTDFMWILEKGGVDAMVAAAKADDGALSREEARTIASLARFSFMGNYRQVNEVIAEHGFTLTNYNDDL